tara:strand:+ start:22 stop:642 length:621 start_codon:yes stop_codon:yes gene_type:complete
MSFKIIKELSLKIKKAVPILLLLITTSCSNGKVGYWEFKIIEKSINTIENIIKIPRKKSSQRIEIPKAPEPPKELKNIAVIDLLGNNISDGETKALSDKLRAELFNTRHFKILEREMLDDVLNEQGLQESGCVSDECVVKIGQLLGVEKIVGGTINKVGETFSTSARIINTSTGTIEKIVSFDYSGPIDELLKKGMRKIAIELIIN